eukprot:CAMPEP_0201902080 /NCGR_PEP_ID=MMETSP0902-20130614/54770_1 /ASSEMBLY_ACC=CAM_ASM_000551 /TAXON_ID=420261 /ORGANISM="Thalassiosira antarctica, Strain CCMP982" /LENGTH=209 /DNA_ID=CAMNT_0048436069 /DNA_START=1424 /DNA_END=2056 /DNA_ORIENTATION=+
MTTNLVQQAKQLDDTKVDDSEEKEEPVNACGDSPSLSLKTSNEARVWVYRKAKLQQAPSVNDSDVQSKTSVVQHDAYAACAPTKIIQNIIRAYPNSAKNMEERGSLPIHLVEKVKLQLFGAYPNSIELRDRKGCTAPKLAKLEHAHWKDIEEKRQMIDMECTASQYGGNDGDENNSQEGSGDGEDGDDDDDDGVVKSNMTTRFRSMAVR